MSDLTYSVEVTGLKDVEQLEKTLDRLHNTLNAGRGSGKSLEEMRKILVGMKGQSSIIADLRDSVKSLNSAAENLGKGFDSGFSRLDRTLKQGFQLTIDRVNMLGAEMSKGLTLGTAKAFDSATAAAATGGQKLAAQVNKDAQLVSQASKDAAAKYTALQNTVRASVRTAMNMPSGSYQAYNPSSGLGGQVKDLEKLKEAKEKAAKAADPLRKSLQALTVDGNDTHSAMRGLASGFNLLWLTWGNLAPLFTGAVISNGFVQTAKTGMEVAHTLAIIENIGGNTKDEVAALNQELLRLGKTGPFGPQEVAEAMKTLSLAGLKATEILSATQSTLNFSIAGTTSIQTAADTLVSVTTAFGMGAQGFERVGDVISKAAAESKTSVESFANAMKTASVIGAQYGVSLEDTATAIATMSQLGIEGTAAGTALRNMYADLSGRSAQVAKVLKAQGIEMRDLTTGGFKPMVQVVAELSDHFDGLTAIGQKNLMQALLSERGAKGLVEMLRLIKVEAKDTSKGFASALEEMRKNVEESYGFTAVNAAKLSQTTKTLFEQMGATLKTSMYEAFTEVEPILSTIAKELKLAFGSEDFKASLTSLVKGVAEVGRSLVQVGVFATENIGIVAMLAAGYKAFAVVANLSAAAQLALTAATKADTAANAANAASQAAKLTGIAAFARFLPGVGTAITVAAGAWALYDAYQRDSSKSGLEFARNYTSDVVKALNDETSKLKELNRLRREGLTLTEAQARLDALDKKAQYVDPYAQTVNSAIKAELAARTELFNRQQEYANHSAKDNKHRVEEQERVVKRLSQQTQTAKVEELAAIRQINKATEDAVAARKEAADLDAIDFENRKKLAQAFGKNSFELGAGGSGSGGNNFVDLNRDKELQALKAHYDAELAVANDYYNKSKQLLDGHRSANLISEEDYMVQSLQLSRSHEAEQLQVLEASLTAYTEASERRKAALESQMSGAKGKGKNMLLDQLKRETQEFEIFVTNYEKERAKVAAESYARVGETVLKLQTEVGKLLKSSDDFWDNAAVSSAAQKDADELAKKYKNMNTSILSMDSAMFEFEKAQKSTQSEVRKMNAALEKQLAIQKSLLQIELLSLQAAQASGRLTLDEAIQRATLISQFKEGIAELEGKISSNTEKGLELGAERGWEAFQKMREKQVEELANSMSEAVVDGLMSGDYKSIGKNIRDILQRELIRKPLTAIINGVMDGIVGSVMGAAGGAAGGAGGILGGAMPGGSFTNWSSMGASVGDWLMTQSTNLGLNGMQGLSDAAFGLGNTTKGVDAWLKDIPGMSGGIGSALGYAGALYSLSQGKYGSAVGSAIGTYILPGIGTMIGSTLGSLVDGMFGGGTDDYGAAARYSGGKLSDSGKAYTYAVLTQSYAQGMQSSIDGLAQTVGTSLDGLAKMFDKQSGYSVQTGFTSDNDDPSRGIFIVQNPEGEVLEKWLHYRSGEFGQRATGYSYAKDPEKGYDDYLKSVTAATIPIFKDIVPAWADSMLDSLSSSLGLTGKKGDWKNIESGSEALQALQQVLQQIAMVEAGFESLGNTMSMFSGLSDDMKTALLGAFGSIQGVTEAAGSYYQNYYSEEERLRKAGETVNAALKSIGVQLDVFGGESAKIQYRELVERAFAIGNQELATQLLQMSAAFSEVANAAKSSKEALTSAYTQESAALENRLLTLLGDSAELRRRELETLSPGNRELQIRIWKLEDEQAIAQQRQGLEQKLLQLQGNTLELRRRELAALDASNAGIQTHIWALEDLAAAQARLDRATSEVASAEAAVGAIRDKATSNYLNALGKVSSAVSGVASAAAAVEAIRDKATSNYLNALDKVNSAISGVASAEEAVEAVRDRATSNYLSALDKVNSLQQSIAEDFRNVFETLSEYLDGFKAPTEQFAQVLKKALAGDSESMKKLPSLADSAISSERDSAGTLVDFQRKQAGILQGVREAAELAEQKAAEVASKSLSMQEQLLQAEKEAAEAAKLANEIGASLVAKQEDLLSEYAKVNASLQESIAARDAAEKEAADAAKLANEIGASLVAKQENLISEYEKANATLQESLVARDAAEKEAAAAAKLANDIGASLVAKEEDLVSEYEKVNAALQESLVARDAAEKEAAAAAKLANETRASLVVKQDELISESKKANDILQALLKEREAAKLELEKAKAQSAADARKTVATITWNDNVEKAKGLQSSLSTAAAEKQQMYDAKDLVGTYLNFHAIHKKLDVTAPPEIAALKQWTNASSTTWANVMEGLEGVSEDTVLAFAKQLQNANLSALSNTTSTSRFVTDKNNLYAAQSAVAASKQTAQEIESIKRELRDLANTYPDLFKESDANALKKFANGGAFTNGIVSTPINFSMGQMGEAGPEAIMPLANVGGSLGVRAVSQDNSELIDEIRALRSEVVMLRAEARATAVNTSKTSRILDDVTQGGDTLAVAVAV